MATTKTAVKLPKSNTPNKKNSKTRLKRSIDFKSRKTQLITFLIAIVVLGGGFFIYRSFAAFTLVGADGEFTPLSPAARILDTRNGTGGVSKAVATKQTVKIKVAGAGGIPASNVSALTINVTAVSPTANGYLKVGAAGAAESATSTINFTAKESITSSINVQVSADGYVQVTNYAGNTHVVFDVAGYYSKAGGTKGLRLQTVTPVRALDTRNNTGGISKPVAQNQTVRVKIAGVGGVPAQGAKAVVMNVTAVNPAAAGFLRIWPSGAAAPTATSLNFVTKKNVANSVTVMIGEDGYVQLLNGGGATDVVFDVAGYYSETKPGFEASQSGRYMPVPPRRVLDTRSSKNPLKPGEARSLSGTAAAPSTAGSLYYENVTSTTQAVVLNVTVINPTAAGYITFWTAGEPRPTSSNLSFSAGQTISNQVIVQIPKDGKIQMYNATGTTEIVIDHVGLVLKDRDDVSTYTFIGAYTTNSDGLTPNPTYEYDLVLHKIPKTSPNTYSDARISIGVPIDDQIGAYYPSPALIFKDGKSKLSFYVKNASVGKFKVLASGGSIIPSTVPGSVSADVEIPYTINEGGNFKFSHAISTDEPGFLGKWLTLNVTNSSGAKTPLLKTFVGPSNQNLTFYYINISASQNASCSSPDQLSFTLTNIKLNGSPPKNTYANQSSISGWGSCPGLTTAAIVQKATDLPSFSGTIGVPKSSRDTTPPVITGALVKLSPGTSSTNNLSNQNSLEVNAKDESSLGNIEASINGLELTSYTHWNPALDSTLGYVGDRSLYNAAYGRSIFYLDKYAPGQYELRVVATDTSGNVQEKLQTITIP